MMVDNAVGNLTLKLKRQMAKMGEVVKKLEQAKDEATASAMAPLILRESVVVSDSPMCPPLCSGSFPEVLVLGNLKELSWRMMKSSLGGISRTRSATINATRR